MIGENRIMIYGPKDDGTYIVEFRERGRRAGDSIPRTEAHVIAHGRTNDDGRDRGAGSNGAVLGGVGRREDDEQEHRHDDGED